MENRQFGAMMPNGRGRMEMQLRQQQQKNRQRIRKQRRRQAQRDGWISCRHCPNKMPAHSMAGKFVLLHSIFYCEE